VRWEIRPLGPWTEPVTKERRSSARFRADWASTLKFLAYETELLGADLVVVQVDADEDDIRRDGMLRARARVGFPGVRVSFTSRHGPLMYATDTYESCYSDGPPGWQANVRAIALALEALRAVDRYGVSKRGEQYTGWRAITAGGSPDPTMTPQEAAYLIAHTAALSGGRWTVHDVFTDPTARGDAYRLAARANHPDAAGGTAEVFAQLSLAREILGRS
jgi:hypothetical protein